MRLAVSGCAAIGWYAHRLGRWRVRVRPQIQAGELRAIAVSSSERLQAMDVPTLKEQGVDVELGTWRGVMAHPRMREADKEALAEAIAAMVKTPTWQYTLTKFGWIDSCRPASQFAEFLKRQQAVLGALRDLGLTGPDAPGSLGRRGAGPGDERPAVHWRLLAGLFATVAAGVATGCCRQAQSRRGRR